MTVYNYDMKNDLTAAEAAKILGVTPHQVRWYHRNGYLSARRFGDVLVFRRVDVERFEKPKKTGRPKAKKR
jgi:DNA-binding transcriptional MerR regulator